MAVAAGCCCMKTQNTIYITSAILIIGWAVQLILSVDRFIAAVKLSHDNQEAKNEDDGSLVGVSGLLVIVDSSQTALSALLLSATFLRDLTKLQPWFILTTVCVIAYVPLSIVACYMQVTSQFDFAMSWMLLLVTMYTYWLVMEFKKEFSSISMERLL